MLDNYGCSAILHCIHLDLQLDAVLLDVLKSVSICCGLQSGVRTFSVQLGQNNVFWICVWLLTSMYGGAFGVGLTSKVCPSMLLSTIKSFLTLR